MPKLIKNIKTTINRDYESIIHSFNIETNIESLKVVNITQDLSNTTDITEMEVKNFGINRTIYNNETIIIDGSDI